MNRLLKKVLFLSFFIMAVQPGIAQNMQARSAPVNDSVRHLLTVLHKMVKNEKLKQQIKATLAIYTSHTISDTLAMKLLEVDSLLIIAIEPDQQTVLPYAQALTRLFRQLPRYEEKFYYPASLYYLGLLFKDMGRYEKALPLYQELLAIRRKVPGEEHPGFAQAANDLGVLFMYMGQYEKALSLFQQALSIRGKAPGENHRDYTDVLVNLAELFMYMGQYDKALPLCLEALEIRKRTLGEDHPDYAKSLNKLAEWYVARAQYNKAMPLLEQALAIQKKAGREVHPVYAASLNSLANLHNRMGQYNKALPLYQQVVALTGKLLGKEHLNYASSLNNLAGLYYETGAFEKALPLYQQALAIRKKATGEENRKYANYLMNMAFLYSNMGQHEKALPLHVKAVAIYKKVLGEEHPDYAMSLSNLAILYVTTEAYEKALPLCLQALSIHEKTLGKEHPAYARSLNNLAELYGKMEQYHQALPLFQQALAIRKKVLGEEHPDYSYNLNKLAEFYFNTGQYHQALPLFQQAFDIRKKVLGEEHPDCINSLNSLGLLYSAMGRSADASAMLARASIQKLQQLKRTCSTLSEQEKITFLNKESARFFHLPSLLFSQKAEQASFVNQVYANELTLKGMVLEDQQQVRNSIRKSGDSTALEWYEQWRSNLAFLSRQLLLPIKQRVAYLDSLQEATNQLEQQLSLRAASFFRQQRHQSITVKDIADHLQKGQAAVEFLRFRYFHHKWTDSTLYAALVLLPRDTAARFVPLFEEKQLQHLLQLSDDVSDYTAIQQLYGSKNSPSGDAGDSLYRLIWKPLEAYLQDVRSIYYAPAGLLHRVAFQALKTGDAQPLIGRYRLHQVISTRSLVLPAQGQVASKPLSASVWGDIAYAAPYGKSRGRERLQQSRNRGGGRDKNQTAADSVSSFDFYTWDTRNIRGGAWEPLPASKKEMDSVKKILTQTGVPVTTASGTVATEEAFKALDGKSPQLLHLATHGFFLPVAETGPENTRDQSGGRTFTMQQNPLFRSGLVLAGGNHAWQGEKVLPGKEDGILTAYELAQMDLSGTGLVVLSACETALGDLQGNEGVIGLQRAFKLAGVKQMIAGLWEVPDKATMELMTLFYRYWLDGLPPGDALRNAQLKMKEKYRQPYFWAAFVLVE